MNHDQAESLMSSLNLSISDLRLLANYYNTSQVKASHRGRTSCKSPRRLGCTQEGFNPSNKGNLWRKFWSYFMSLSSVSRNSLA